MTIDERLEFLLQSTESLPSNLAGLTQKVDNLASAQRQTDLQINTLVNVIGKLTGVVSVHETRIKKLEQ